MNKNEQEIFKFRVNQIKEYLARQISVDNAVELAKQIVTGAEGGNEFGKNNFDSWLSDRFIPQLVWLSSDDYTRGITRALPQALRFTGSDFGSAKQRDFGQLWMDTTRGLLGEIAVQKFFKDKLNTEIELDTSIDQNLDDYITTDIKFVKESSGAYRNARINTSIKTGKFNARWLDEYSATKINKIDVFIFVRLGMPKEHFIAYLKNISFLRDKLIPRAIEIGEITNELSLGLWNAIPNFELIPAYVVGFLAKQNLQQPIHSITLEIKGKPDYQRGDTTKDTRKIYIKKGIGIFTKNNVCARPEFQQLNVPDSLPILIAGIEKQIDNKEHFYANTGSFDYGMEKWQCFAHIL
ncbi:hypothetical protein [Synechococcus sp. C9]|jgi:hypothetical protein|uniref:hypothetical protein n=1 Tax=Synechococcus sp. C9 TaxID=102119 RepID=UPI001FF172DF|nr:hypothetical protein [Synechococcus sp. C9]